MDSDTKTFGNLISLVIIILFVLWVAPIVSERSKAKKKDEKPARPSLTVGGLAVTTQPTAAAVSEDAYKRCADANDAGDTYGRWELLLSGEVEGVDRDVLVKVLDPYAATGLAMVRFLEGPLQGRALVIARSSLKPYVEEPASQPREVKTGD